MARVRLAAPPHRPGYLPPECHWLIFYRFQSRPGEPMIGHLPLSFPATFLPGATQPRTSFAGSRTKRDMRTGTTT